MPNFVFKNPTHFVTSVLPHLLLCIWNNVSPHSLGAPSFISSPTFLWRTFRMMDIGTIYLSCHYFYTLNTNNIYEVLPHLTVCPHHISLNWLSNQGLKSWPCLIQPLQRVTKLVTHWHYVSLHMRHWSGWYLHPRSHPPTKRRCWKLTHHLWACRFHVQLNLDPISGPVGRYCWFSTSSARTAEFRVEVA